MAKIHPVNQIYVLQCLKLYKLAVSKAVNGNCVAINRRT